MLRDLTFCPGSLRPAADRYRNVRRVGRPRNESATKLHEEALKVAAQHPAKTLDSLLKGEIDFERNQIGNLHCCLNLQFNLVFNFPVIF